MTFFSREKVLKILIIDRFYIVLQSLSGFLLLLTHGLNEGIRFDCNVVYHSIVTPALNGVKV